MTKTGTKSSQVKRKHHRRTAETPRAKLERTLGRKFLRGEIPVVPPSQLPRCPVPATHVKDFEQCCQDYAEGKLSESEVLTKVGEALKTLRKPVEQPKPEGEP